MNAAPSFSSSWLVLPSSFSPFAHLLPSYGYPDSSSFSPPLLHNFLFIGLRCFQQSLLLHPPQPLDHPTVSRLWVSIGLPPEWFHVSFFRSSASSSSRKPIFETFSRKDKANRKYLSQRKWKLPPGSKRLHHLAGPGSSCLYLVGIRVPPLFRPWISPGNNRGNGH